MGHWGPSWSLLSLPWLQKISASRVWWNLQSNYRYCEEDQIPIVPTTGSAIHWINHYPEEKRYQAKKIYMSIHFFLGRTYSKECSTIRGAVKLKCLYSTCGHCLKRWIIYIYNKLIITSQKTTTTSGFKSEHLSKISQWKRTGKICASMITIC